MVEFNAAKKWNDIYAACDLSNAQENTKAAHVLREYSYLLPTSGLALDLACGLGGTAKLLARLGLLTHAWDISENAISHLQLSCKEQGIKIITEVRDIERKPPIANSFDVICVSYYLERHLVKNIIDALRPNGLLFYQTFINEKVSNNGPSNPSYRLQPNELLALFSPLHILVYQENGTVGDTNQGIRDTALLVAQKRIMTNTNNV